MSVSGAQLWRTAVHEAGHCVVMLLRGHTPPLVVVRDDGTGSCYPAAGESDHDEIETLIAGGVAERLICGPGGFESIPDRDNAQRVAARRYGASAARNEVARIERDVRALVARHTRAIAALATELQRRSKLTGDEARAIVRQYVPNIRDEPAYRLSAVRQVLPVETRDALVDEPARGGGSRGDVHIVDDYQARRRREYEQQVIAMCAAGHERGCAIYASHTRGSWWAPCGAAPFA